MISFKLSEPGSPLSLDPAMLEYLRYYEFPLPPRVRYGFTRISSPQEKQRVSIFAQAWVPGHATGTVLLLHGYCEHSGNYSKLVRELVENQLAVIALDHRGHGLSEGPASHVQQPFHYAEDSETIINQLFSQVLPNRPLFFWAHSMGAMVALQIILRGNLQSNPSAVVLTSPLLGFPELTGAQKILSFLSPLLAKITPSFPIAHGMSPQYLSHDELYLARRFEDPLIKKVTTPQWFEATKLSVSQLQQGAEKLQAMSPTLLMLAGNEKVTNLSAARSFAFRAYAGLNHKVIEFPSAYHELEKEPDIRQRVVSESIAWFRSHL